MNDRLKGQVVRYSFNPYAVWIVCSNFIHFSIVIENVSLINEAVFENSSEHSILNFHTDIDCKLEGNSIVLMN